MYPKRNSDILSLVPAQRAPMDEGRRTVRMTRKKNAQQTHRPGWHGRSRCRAEYAEREHGSSRQSAKIRVSTSFQDVGLIQTVETRWLHTSDLQSYASLSISRALFSITVSNLLFTIKFWIYWIQAFLIDTPIDILITTGRPPWHRTPPSVPTHEQFRWVLRSWIRIWSSSLHHHINPLKQRIHHTQITTKYIIQQQQHHPWQLQLPTIAEARCAFGRCLISKGKRHLPTNGYPSQIMILRKFLQTYAWLLRKKTLCGGPMTNWT